MELATKNAKLRNVNGIKLIVIARWAAEKNRRKTTTVMMSVTIKLVTLTTVFAAIAPVAVLPQIFQMGSVILIETMCCVGMTTGLVDVGQDVQTLQATLLIILDSVMKNVCTIHVDMITRVRLTVAIN